MARRLGSSGAAVVRVLIVGEGKSGTTALMASIVARLDNPVEVFEPKQLLDSHVGDDSVVVKKLLLDWTLPEGQIAELFDKRILIERDPRDRLISHLLYDAYNKAPLIDAAGRSEWLETLQDKVDDPTSVSLARLMQRWWKLSNADLLSDYVRACTRNSAFMRNSSESFHVLKYEDYVAGEFDRVNEYLGLSLAAGVVSESERRVSRSKSSGAWRHWFTQDDADLFQPMTDRVLRLTGRDTDDWQVAAEPSITYETSVGYVESLFEQRPFEPEKSEQQIKRRNKIAAKWRSRTSGAS